MTPASNLATARTFSNTQRDSMDANLTTNLSLTNSVSSAVLYSPRYSLCDLAGRICLSRGTCRADTIDTGAQRYVSDARVPLLDWRLATHEELSVLWSVTAPPAHRGVGIVRLLSPQLIRLFEDRDDIFQRADDGDTLKHPLVGLLLDIIRNAGIETREIHSARVGRDDPGLVTMTRAVDQDARVGMHFDMWDRLAVDDLEAGSNRVSVNLGPGDRYFIFLNQTVVGMAATLKRKNVPFMRDVRSIGAAFMSAFPDYPIVRLRLQPGDAYIAPTENILHDGNSSDVVEINHYLSVRGRFDFAAGRGAK
jgi:hypothetical protein